MFTNNLAKGFCAAAAAVAIAASSYCLGVAQGTNEPTSQGSLTVNAAPVGLSRGVSKDSVNDPKGKPVKGAIADAKAVDPAGLERRIALLKSSPEFVSFLTENTGAAEKTGLEGLAASITESQARAFVQSIQGKKFIVSADKLGQPVVQLVQAAERPAVSPANVSSTLERHTGANAQTAGWNGPSCWQGWFAAAGYSAATGAICGAVGAMSFGLVGAACGAAAWAGGMGINWNDAC
ncbi:hypothetical protein [Sinomonas sp. G460-2]|uniref:hypothetical protein n=1 Tax=Sinomonas sp. G460-2 TaxID=3393464 RepID=UPI0039F03EEE